MTLAKVFAFRLPKMNSELHRLEQRSFIKFLQAKKRYLKFIEESVMYRQKDGLIKNLYKWTKHVFDTTSRAEKTVS